MIGAILRFLGGCNRLRSTSIRPSASPKPRPSPTVITHHRLSYNLLQALWAPSQALIIHTLSPFTCYVIHAIHTHRRRRSSSPPIPVFSLVSPPLSLDMQHRR